MIRAFFLFLFLPIRVLFFLYQLLRLKLSKSSEYFLEIPEEFQRERKSFFYRLLDGKEEAPTFIQFLNECKLIGEHKNIRKVHVYVPEIQFGTATVYLIREELLNLKHKGIEIEIFCEAGNLDSLLLMEVGTTRLSISSSEFHVKIPSIESIFYGEFFKKWKVEIDVFQSGKYKSFGETFTRKNFTQEAKANLEFLVKDLNSEMENSLPSLDKSIRKLPFLHAELLKEKGFLHQFVEETEFVKRRETSASYSILARNHYVSTFRLFPKRIPKVILFPLEGSIQAGSRQEKSPRSGTIEAYPIREALREISEDKSIRGVLFLVNSPGGSALHSEILYREIKALQENKLIFSYILDVGASGGYYISLGAKEIHTTPFSILGSIGAIALRPNLKKTLENFGVTTDVVGDYSGREAFSLFSPLRGETKQFFQKEIQRVEDQFYTRVMENRKKTRKEMESIGQGKVYSGKKSLELGLVDSITTINQILEKMKTILKTDKLELITSLPEYSWKAAMGKFSLLQISSAIKNKTGIQYRFLGKRGFF